jgi:hypothetical protein
VRDLPEQLRAAAVFYSHSAEMLARAAILMTFERLELPLQSPRRALVPIPRAHPRGLARVQALITEVREFFHRAWKRGKIAPTEGKKTAVTSAQMTHWLRFPYLALQPVPQCPPPDLALLATLGAGDESSKDLDSDHKPPLPPPGEKSAALQQLQSEFRMGFADAKGGDAGARAGRKDGFDDSDGRSRDRGTPHAG